MPESRSLATRFVVAITATTVIIVGIFTLLGLVFGNFTYTIPTGIPVIGGQAGDLPAGEIARVALRLAVTTVAFLILVGVANLISVNTQRIIYGRTNTAKLNSAVVLIAFMFGILTPLTYPVLSDFLLENVQTTIESALAALVFFALVYGAFRMLRRKVTINGMLFVLTIEIVLIGALPAAQFAPVRAFTEWLINVPVNAGARGILLGIALATLITGLRVLIGQDRTYGE
ncbi:MAG: hypothetical protein AAF126_09035 [Chloroflexota bacterium]